MMLGKERELIIRNGGYRIECTTYGINDIIVELVVYYDKSNKMVCRRLLDNHTSIYNPGTLRIYTMENDITIRYYISHKPNRMDSIFGDVNKHHLNTSIDVSVDIQPPKEFDRSVVLSRIDIYYIRSKYDHHYSIIGKSKNWLIDELIDISKYINSLYVTSRISPSISSDDMIQDLINRLFRIDHSLVNQIHNQQIDYEKNIKLSREMYEKEGINTSTICSSLPAIDVTDKNSASYIRWERHGRPGISVIRLG